MNRISNVGRQLLFSPKLALICRIVLGLTFVFAGWSKIGHPAAVIENVLSYNILPDYLVRPFALILPWLEVVSGLLLISGLLTYSAGAMLAVLNLTFLIAVGVNLLRGSSIDCGCFGQSETLSWWIFGRDVVYFLMSCQILATSRGFLSLDNVLLTYWHGRSDRSLSID